MNLAAAVMRKVVYVESKSVRKPAAPKPARRPEVARAQKRSSYVKCGPSGMPIKYIEQAGMIYIIGRISCAPVSWMAVTDWVCDQAGVSITSESMRERVKKFAVGRCNSGSELHAQVAQYYIVCKLHGVKQPWPGIARHLSQQGISKDRRRLTLDTLAWMRRHLARTAR